jgi:hypothetical protein
MPADGGYDFASICVRIAELGVERHGRRRHSRLQAHDLPR